MLLDCERAWRGIFEAWYVVPRHEGFSLLVDKVRPLCLRRGGLELAPL